MGFAVYVPWNNDVDYCQTRFNWAKELCGYDPYTQICDWEPTESKIQYIFEDEEHALLFALRWK